MRMSFGVRELGLSACVLLVAAGAAAGQSSVRTSTGSQQVFIGGDGTNGPRFERCVDVQIGGDRAFGCLNDELRRETDKVNPSFNMPPIDARSPDIRVGNVNEAAVRQQYGRNYGVSAFPYRPPPPVFPRR